MLISFTSNLTVLHVCNVCTIHIDTFICMFLRHRYLGEDFQFSGKVSLGQIDTVSMLLLLSSSITAPQDAHTRLVLQVYPGLNTLEFSR